MKCPVCEIHAESVFRVEGMDCHEEVAILERRLKPLGGLEDLTADIIGRRLRVQYDAARAVGVGHRRRGGADGHAGLARARAARRPSCHGHARPTSDAARRVRGSCLASSALGDLADAPAAVRCGARADRAVDHRRRLSAAARARQAIRSRVLDINVLMMFAVAGALLLGEWAEAGTGHVSLRAGAVARSARDGPRARRHSAR